jgi:predicted ATP-grasp superfamily ATP-dependent carboligase
MNVANPLTKAIKKKLGKRRLFYVCRDAERAEAGLLLGISNFTIITNDSPFGRMLKGKFSKQIILIETAEPLDTLDILKRGETAGLIRAKDLVMVFKPTVQIEAACKEKGWTLLNPPAALANRVEEKLSQIEWLGELKRYLPETKIAVLKNVEWRGKKFIMQFNRAHTGSGTILIESKKQLEALKKKFPEREARISKYIKGPMITNNNIVWGNRVLSGNMSYQITGLAPFTDNAFATIGNDWSLPTRILTAGQVKAYHKIAEAVGKRLSRDGWRGLFGLDMIADEKTGRFYLIEINARQPASTSFESILQ